MWPRFVTTAIGVWLMAAPAVLSYGPPMAWSDRIVGPLVATVGIVAMSEVMRALRWVNVVLGLWVLVAPIALDAPSAAVVNGLVCGPALVGFALVRGGLSHRYAGGWRAVLRSWDAR